MASTRTIAVRSLTQDLIFNGVAGQREGKEIADASLTKLFRAAEPLRQEAAWFATTFTRRASFGQWAVLQRRHVQVLARQSVGKESDNLEENEFIGEDAGPIEHPMEGSSIAKIAAFVVEAQKKCGGSDRMLLDHAKVSPYILDALRNGKVVEDDVLQRLPRAMRL
jgi:hypothetical protein